MMFLVVVIGITTIKLDVNASNIASTLATPQFTLTNTASGVTVNWNFVDNATGYIVYRREPSGTYQKVAGFTDGKTKSYTDKTVVNGKKYYYAVKAINAKTQSKYNNKLITYASKLTTPQFTLTNAGNGIKISWNLVNNAAGYIVYRREGNGAFKKVAGFTDGVTKSYVDTTAVNGKTYSYAVKAINGSVQSTYVSKSIAFVKTLSTPQFTLTNTSTGVKIDWNLVSNATGYIVYRRQGSGAFQKVAGFTDGTTKSYVDKTAISGTKYSYAVKAINGSVQSKYVSKEIQVAKSLTVPQFTLTSTSTGVKVDWDMVNGATGYIVYRREGNEAFKKVAGFTDGTTKSYVDKTAVSGKKYTYAVKALNGNVQSKYDTKEITYLTTLATPQFTLEQVDGGVQISWNFVDNATGYIVYRRTKNGTFSKIAGFTDGKTKSYVDTSVVSETEYYYAVKAINGSIQSTYTSKAITYVKKQTYTIKVWAPSYMQVENDSWLKRQCEAFAAEHPEWDITFEYGECMEGYAGETVVADVENAADVYCYANDNLETLLAANGIMALSGSDKAFVENNFGQTYIDCVTKDGNIYGVPYGSNTWFMYYNKSVYTEEDVKSLDKMLEKGTVMFPLTNSWYIEAFYLATGAEFFGGTNDNDAGINVGGENGLKATNYLVDLVANPNFECGEFGDAYWDNRLADGTIAAAFSGTWDKANAQEALGDNYAVAALPAITIDGKDYQLKNFSGAKAFGVNATTEYPELATALAVYLGSKDAQKDLYDTCGNIPAIDGMETMIPNEPIISVINEVYAKCSIMQPYCTNMGSWWTPASVFGNELVAGNITHENAEEKTEAFNEAVNEQYDAIEGEKGLVYYLNFKPEQAEQWKALATAYTEETGVEVTVVTPSMGTYGSVLQSEMEKEDAPTLFQVNGPVGLEAWKDYCYDLTGSDLYGEVKSDDFVLKNGSSVAGIAYVIESYGLIYNKSIMADYLTKDYSVIEDMSELNNFETLKAVAESIQANKDDLGVEGAFTSAGMGSSSDWRFKTYLANLPIYYEYKADDIGYTSAIKGTYLDNYKQIWDLYINNATCAPTDLLNKEGWDAESEFISGQAVFFQNGDWEYGALIDGGMTDDQIGMLPIYIGVEGEENQGLCTGSENYWCVNKNVSQEEIDATLDFLYWCVTSDTGRDAIANDMGFTTPFKAFDDDYTANNALKQAANEYIANGKTAVSWNFPSIPSEAWKDGVAIALTAYAAGTGDWEAVEKAFVDGWATEYAKANN